MRFIVKTVRETGTITYHCASPKFALEKVHDFRQANYRDISVFDADETQVAESRLELIVSQERAYQLNG